MGGTTWTVRRVGSASARISLAAVATWLITGFVFTIPFEEIVTIPVIGSTTRLIGIVLLPIALVALIRDRRLALRMPMVFVVLALLFVIWNLATYFWSIAPAATFRQVFTYAQLFVFVWLVAEFCRERAKLLGLMQAFVLGNYVAFSITAINVLILSAGGSFRDTGRFNANEFAIVLALGIPMAAFLMVERRAGILHALNVLYPIVAVFGIVLGASRGGLLVGLTALTVVPIVLVHWGVVRRLVLLGLLLVTVWFGFAYAPQAFPELTRNVERLSTTGDELAGGTLTGRTELWAETIALFTDSPLIGIGSGAVPHALAETTIGRAKSVHNAFLSVAAGTGLLGGTLFVALIVVAIGSVFLATGLDRAFLLVLAAALIVSMMPANAEARKFLWFILVLLASFRPILLTRRSPGRTP
jgi:O-antigen ligase